MASATVNLKLTPTEYRVVCSALRDYYHICDAVVTEVVPNIPTRLHDCDRRTASQERERVKQLRDKIEPTG